MSVNHVVSLMVLGGVGEFGRNSMRLDCGPTRVLIDCGVRFPEDDQLGVEQLIPDFEAGLEGEDIDALLLTHGHEDHIGAIPHLMRYLRRIGATLPLPIYGSRFTIGLVHRRLAEWDFLDDVELHVCQHGEVELEELQVEFIPVNHSIPGARALCLNTPAGRILHSGDWRMDTRPVGDSFGDFGRLAQLGAEGVDLLLSDSTNAGVPGFTRGEAEVGETFEDLFELAPGRVLVTMFSSNISRLQSVLNAADQAGRSVAVMGRSLERNVQLARDTGHLRLPSNDLLVPLSALQRRRDYEAVIVVGGSQGEPHSTLTRVSRGEHHQLQIREGDWVLYSSRMIPGNERKISNVVDALESLGAKVVLPTERPGLHASGHAKAEEVKLFFRLLSPARHIPIHGGYRQLRQHAGLAKALGIKTQMISRGEVIEVHDDCRVSRRVEVQTLCVAGSGEARLTDAVLSERRRIGHGGVVFIHSLRDKQGDSVLAPQVVALGITAGREALERGLSAFVEEIVARDVHPLGLDETIRRETRRWLRKRYGRKPTVVVTSGVVE